MLILGLGIFTSKPSFSSQSSSVETAPIRIIFKDWSKREAGEYIKYRESVLFNIVDLGFRNYHAKCDTKTLLESPFTNQIQLIVELTCTGSNVHLDSFNDFIMTLQKELNLEIYRDIPVGPGGAGVRN